MEMLFLASFGEILGYIGYVLIAVLVLLVMITVHELGHYIAGKLLGFGIEEFAIGFGPKLYSKTKENGEVFSVRLLPIGGFCAFVGEDNDIISRKEGDLMYSKNKDKIMFISSMTIFGTLFNAVYLLPTFAVMYHMPLEGLIGMGTALNANVTDVFTFVAFCVAPLNLLKGGAVSVVTFVLYKPLSPILKTTYEVNTKTRRVSA